MFELIVSSVLSTTFPASNLCGPLEALDLEVVCQEHPWQRAAVCGFAFSLDQCVGLLKVLSTCGLTDCEYIECSQALALAGCFERPAVCDVVEKCIG